MLLVALLVAGTIVATVAGTFALTRRSDATGPPTPPACSALLESRGTRDCGATTAPPAAPTDPRSAFRDPALRALAESFLAGPAVSCAQRAPAADEAESVACDLGGGRTAVFTRMVTPDVAARAAPRRRRRPGGRTRHGACRCAGATSRAGRGPGPGSRPGEDDRGEGVRVRFVDREGVPRLYFDQDSSGCTGDLALTRPTGNDRADLEALRIVLGEPAHG